MIDLKELELYESTHRYFYKRKLMLAVTDIFQKTGMADFSKVKAVHLEKSVILGDYVHEMAKLYALKKLDQKDLDERLEGYLKSIKKFFKENVRRVIALEKSVCNPVLGFAGTPDLVYENHKRLICLDDYKTPDDEHATWKYQTAAYQNAWEKCFPKQRIDQRAGVMLRSDGTYHREIYKGSQDFDDFLSCLRVTQIKIKEKIKT